MTPIQTTALPPALIAALLLLVPPNLASYTPEERREIVKRALETLFTPR